MWLTKFLDITNKMVSPNPFSGIEDALINLNPEKIYIENVRSLLGTSYYRAEEICEKAVSQGLFRRSIEVLCPNNVVAASAERNEDLPSQVTCWIEEDGDIIEKTFPVTDLKKVTFYRLIRNASDTTIHG